MKNNNKNDKESPFVLKDKRKTCPLNMSNNLFDAAGK